MSTALLPRKVPAEVVLPPRSVTNTPSIPLEPATCPLCKIEDAEPVGIGPDYEYRTSEDTFLAVRCLRCGLVYLNPRPTEAAMPVIYPDHYHAFEFQSNQFGLIYRVRQRLEARRLLKWCHGLPADAKILDVGCGDGFHLKVLREYAPKTWQCHGIDTDPRAIAAAKEAGLTVFQGSIEKVKLENSYHLAILVMTIEHVADPVRLLEAVRERLLPGGRLIVVTDNVASPDFKIFGGSYWGGYHFPRHLCLFNRKTLAQVAERAGFQTDRVVTAMSPVNWVYSVRNMVDDMGAPGWVKNLLSLKSPLALAAGTLLDLPLSWLGHGAILQGFFHRGEN